MKYLIAFVTQSFNAGNYTYNSKKIDITDIKEQIEKEFGHKPEETIILNIMKINA